MFQRTPLLAVVPINFENGIITCKSTIDIDNMTNFDAEIIEFDDTFSVEDIIESIEDVEAEYIAIVDCQNAIQYCLRLVNSIAAGSSNFSEISVVSKSLSDSTKCNLNGTTFYSFVSIEQLNENFSRGESDIERELSINSISNVYDESYKKVMQNGYIAAITGLYPENIPANSVKHILMSADSDVSNVLRFSYPSLNSAFFVHDKSNYALLSQEINCFSHFHFFVDHINVKFDDSEYCTNYIQCSMDEFYSKRCSGLNNNIQHIVSVSTVEDYNALEKMLRLFESTGKIPYYNFWIVDECRFINSCSMAKLHRIQIDGEKISCCNVSNIPLGNLSDSKSMCLSSAITHKKKAEAHRKCDVCDANSYCAKCCAVSLEGDSYCDFIKAHPNTSDFLSKKNFVGALMSQSGFFATKENIQISNRCFSVFYSENSNPNQDVQPFILLLIDNKTFLFDLRKSVCVKIDPKLYLILEGKIKNASEDAIVTSLAKNCSTTTENALGVYKQGIEILRQSGFIH